MSPPIGYRLVMFASKLVAQVYVVFVRGAFAAFGARSRIGRGAKLVCPHLVSIGEDVMIAEMAWLNAKDDRQDGRPTLLVGNGSYIGRFAHINAWRSVKIGQDVMISDRVFISDADHRYEDPDIAVSRQGDSFFGGVELQDGCWIGIGAVILPGVTIGRNAVVSANSVVTRSVPDRSVVGGVPAQIISLR